MANTSVCTTCLRALRQQARRDLQRNSSLTPSRATRLLSTTRSHLAEPVHRKPPPPPKSPIPANFDISSFAATVRQSETLRGTTEPYIAYGSTEDLVRACTAQCDYTIPSVKLSPPQPPPKNAAEEDIGEGAGWWYTPKTQGGLGLDVTFNTWAQVVMLHMYCLTVRLRCFPKEHVRVWHQNLLDHFFYAAEDRMAVWHNMSARGIRNRYLKDLWLQWRGLLLSYDEGLIKGDAVLATAVWRNMFKGREDVDVADVALVTAYVRRQLKMLDGLDDSKVASGEVAFESPEVVKQMLDRESMWMRKSFTAEDLKSLEGEKA